MAVTASATNAYWQMLADELLAKLQQPDAKMKIGNAGWAEKTLVAIDTAQADLHSPQLTKDLSEVYKSDDYTVVATARIVAGDMSNSASEAGLFVGDELFFVRNFESVPVQDMDYFDVKFTIPFKV
ncbi:MAG: hypothetical protein KVP17_002334 [Porospora cf. gigantea B]|uniref:uncharacterized protein n=2 Tax=Porospora cf. gigantea B TaxID=2853592 RepID=UPI0035719BA2|nr:MAG: hypothetical protein KVP17_002334 [Porospora cf. gigantea B]